MQQPTIPAHRSHRLRAGRVSAAGRIYHLRFSTHEGRPLLVGLSKCRKVVLRLREAQERGLATTLAFVVMPDHVHWLCRLGFEQALSQVVGGVKARVARDLVLQEGCSLPVWQSGYFDRAIRDEAQLLPLARYIVANPLRKGLAAQIGDYSHWDAVGPE